MVESHLRMGMLGMSIEAISEGKQGFVKLPIGPRDPTFWGGRVWLRVKVTAMENVRAERDIIVGNDQGEVKEHTPVELSYEERAGGYQRVGEVNPLPITLDSLTEDLNWATIEATAAGNTSIVVPTSGKKIRVKWYSISNKHTAVADVGMRFGAAGTIKHKYGLAPEGGAVTANLISCNWEGEADETLYASLIAAYSGGVYFTVGYLEED